MELGIEKGTQLYWSVMGFKNFWWSWTSFPIWKISNIFDLQYVHMFMFNPWTPVAKMKPVIFFCSLWIYRRSKMFETCQILFVLFCLQKYQFWFLLMLRTSSAEVRQKKTQGNANCSPPKTFTGVNKVANERYLPYLQFCGKASMWIFMYSRCTSGPKLR